MRAVARLTPFALAIVLMGASRVAGLAAQESFGPPQAPCQLTQSNSKINNGIQALKTAVEKPDQRATQLAQARKALTDAIVQDGQSGNPAAWYYLGRHAVLAGDAAAADTAFARAASLAPACVADIATYRDELWGRLVNDALTVSQDGKLDSALALLHAAARLEPHNPKAFATAAALYASRGNDDSAYAYYRLAGRSAGDDTTYASDKREALSNAWHLLVRKVQGHPAAQRAARVRGSLDSLQRAITADSIVLARLVGSSQSRKARGAKLAPADQQLFTRDSTARAQAVARGRSALAAALQQLAADSTALTAAFAPAIGALNEYVAAFPVMATRPRRCSTPLAPTRRIWIPMRCSAPAYGWWGRASTSPVPAPWRSAWHGTPTAAKRSSRSPSPITSCTTRRRSSRPPSGWPRSIR